MSGRDPSDTETFGPSQISSLLRDWSVWTKLTSFLKILGYTSQMMSNALRQSSTAWDRRWDVSIEIQTSGRFEHSVIQEGNESNILAWFQTVESPVDQNHSGQCIPMRVLFMHTAHLAGIVWNMALTYAVPGSGLAAWRSWRFCDISPAPPILGAYWKENTYQDPPEMVNEC